MRSLVDAMNAWSQAWASLMWAVLWQSTLLAAVVALIAFVLRRSAPGLRFWLWQIVAIKFLLMPFWTLAVPLPFLRGSVVNDAANGPRRTTRPAAPDGPPISAEQPVPATAIASSIPQDSTATRLVREMTWQSWLLACWFVLLLWQIARMVLQRIRLARLLGRSTPADSRITSAVLEAAERLRLRRTPQAVFTEVDCSPFVCGLCRPVLVLPAGLADTLGAAQLHQVLLHELAHIKRYDLLWNWLPEITRMIYTFHPIVHWVCHRIHLERELACDQLAMSASGASAADYAETLVHIVSHSSQPAILKAGRSSLDRSTSERLPF